MTRMMFVDGNNLVHRCAYTHMELTYNNAPIGATYGVFRSLGKMRREFPLHKIVVVWDMGHKRRDQVSQGAVDRGIVPETYKENRKRSQGAQGDLVRWQINQQWEIIREGLTFTAFEQLGVQGYEADDVIGTCVMGGDDSCIICSSDKDFYQLLVDGVVIVDPINEKKMDLATFRLMYGLDDSQQWIDVGALMGDKGDNIFGVPGVGEKTALKLIKHHGRYTHLLDYLDAAKETRRALSKIEERILAYRERITTAYLLKRIDLNVEGCPPSWQKVAGDAGNLQGFFQKWGFVSLLDQVEVFT